VKHPIRTGLIVAGLQIAAGLLATAGARLGYFDQDMATRITMVAIGLALLFYANFASKAVSRSARFIAINRFAAWSLALGALAWTGIWLFAPMEIANLAATAAVMLGVLATAGYYGFRTLTKTTT
jgi:hypothetical protein